MRCWKPSSAGRSSAIRRSEPNSEPGFFTLSALLAEALSGSRLMAGSKSGLGERRKRPSGSLAIVCAIEHARVNLLTFCYGTFLKGSLPPWIFPKGYEERTYPP